MGVGVTKSQLKRINALKGGDWELYKLVKEHAPSNVAPTSEAPVVHDERVPGLLTKEEA